MSQFKRQSIRYQTLQAGKSDRVSYTHQPLTVYSVHRKAENKISKYSENKTQFKDPELLCLALVAMGYSASMIENHLTNPASLLDWHGNTTHYLDAQGDKAELIIRRSNVNQVMKSGSSNDFGFRRDKATSCYSAVISEYDSRYFNADWMLRLKTEYAKQAVNKQALKLGYRATGTKVVNGKIRMQYIKA